MALEEVINDLKDYLDYRIQEGDRTVSIPPELLQTPGTKAVAKAPAAAPPPPVEAPPVPRTAPVPQTRPAQPVASPAPMSPQQRVSEMTRLAAQITACTKCDLHKTRNRTVPGQGCLGCHIMFIGEAPGHEEDAAGVAFAGKAGQLLTKMITAMGFTRDHVFVGDILKCRPPQDRKPQPAELSACLPYLRQQIALIRPQTIVALGSTAAQALLQTDREFSHLRGVWGDLDGVPLMPTYHPAYLLENPAAKRDAWADLKLVLSKLGRTPPANT